MAEKDNTETSSTEPELRKARVRGGVVVAPDRKEIFVNLGLHACYEVETLAGILLERARSGRTEGLDTFAKVVAIRMVALSGVLMDVLNEEGQESSVQVVEGISFEAFECERNALASATEM